MTFNNRPESENVVKRERRTIPKKTIVKVNENRLRYVGNIRYESSTPNVVYFLSKVMFWLR